MWAVVRLVHAANSHFALLVGQAMPALPPTPRVEMKSVGQVSAAVLGVAPVQHPLTTLWATRA